MDIKEIIKDAVEKLMKDEALRKQFMDDPVKALEKILNVDLPDDLINPVIDGIKAKLTAETVADVAEDAAKFLKKLF
ncbi:MAG: hypothetical protein IKM20_01170 [Erysipelotrichales bacterium]|nr:hypothetical protein [Erysipelotrichales bacterium]